MLYRPVTHRLRARRFDPLVEGGPQLFDLYHINNVFADHTGLYVAGAGLDGLFKVEEGPVERIADLPLGTHTACRRDGWLMYHDTQRGQVSTTAAGGRQPQYYLLPHYAEDLSRRAAGAARPAKRASIRNSKR